MEAKNTGRKNNCSTEVGTALNRTTWNSRNSAVCERDRIIELRCII